MIATAEQIWVDGSLVSEKDDTHVSLLAHTLHYGVGAFEGIRAYQRSGGQTAVFRLDAHIERLFNSCKLVGLEPGPSEAQVIRACHDVLRANRLSAAYIRPLVFLGAGALGLIPKSNPVRTAVMAWEWGSYLGKEGQEKGIRCQLSAWQKLGNQNGFPQGKLVGQYVGSVVAKQQALRDGYDEALLVNSDGYVVEGAAENLFIVQNGDLLTPPTSSGILPGITRATVMTLAREQGLNVREDNLTRDSLYLADEIFLTGTAAEVTPVRSVDGKPIGSGGRGPITETLQARYFDIVAGADDSHPEWLHVVSN